MHFKKLELFGFKSFADKTILNFEEGITAIVGPNGCGKSNIFDSVRWVLGEQSVKELRGSSMEDVIFNGTELKPSLGFAEVSLTFSNESRMLAIEENEVTITRRLFRSGESEYLINKVTCRLRDVQEMLMGTGIGAEAYSLIQQGEVDLMVSAHPEDRRLIFDEAAGITKYKAKKKEALNKLKDTENNLLRINDIITEVKRHIASIERQANKARKFKDEYEKLKILEVKLARYDMAHSTTQKNQINSFINTMNEKISVLNRNLEEKTNALDNNINDLSELEQKINDVHSNEIKLEAQIDLNNRQIGFDQERIGNIEQNAVKLQQQKVSLIERCRLQQEKIEEFQRSICEIEQSFQENEAVLIEKRENFTNLEQLINEAKGKIKDHEDQILSLTSSQVNVRNDLIDVMKELQGSLARKRRLEHEQQKVRIEKQSVDQKFQNIEYQIQCVQGTVVDLVSERDNENQVFEDISMRLGEINKKIDALDKKRLFFKSQKEFIEKMHSQYNDMQDPVVEGRLFTQIRPLDHHTGIIGKVKEFHSVDLKETERIKKLWGEPYPQEIYEIICETKFIELDPVQIGNKIDEITQEINLLTEHKENFTQKAEGHREKITQIEEEIQNKERVKSACDAQRSAIIEEVNKLSQELELIDLETSEVSELSESSKKKEDELNFKLDTINKDIGWCQNDIKERQMVIALNTQQKEETNVAIVQMETEMSSNKEKLQGQNDNFRMFSETLDNWLEEMKKIEDEVTGQGQQKKRFEEDILNLQQKIEQIKNEKELLKQELIDLESLKSEKGQQINSSREQMTSLEEEIETIKKGLHDRQLQEQELSFGENRIKDRLQQTYKINIDEILPEQVDVNEEDSSQPDSLREDIGRLKKRCDAFGSVNLVAIEEFEELKERFEFLTKQQSDLLESKSQLMNTIQSINRSTRQMFMDTFTKIGENFRIYFRMLFGGGEAQLILMDPENVLESGIEIVAKPPGKKLQSISLLSGGEKSLTAIALIFGVFKVKPSPFCILDEIDAALDESNVGRFTYLLKDFSKIAQFIVITHNKKTIESSDIMYGITMPERGISRIVSVKFSDDKKKQIEEVPVPA